MGIKGLSNLIKKNSPNSITINDIKKYHGSTVAIDTSILLYKFKYASKIENSHLVGLANRIKYYLMNGILPVFIFDGEPVDAKKTTTIIKRQAAKEKLYIKLDDLKEKIKTCDDETKKFMQEEIDRINSQIIVVKKVHVDQCKEFLQKSGIPFCIAPDDAEKFCSFLQKKELVDYTVTDDSDAITFGSTKILKTSINKNIVEINTNKILEDLEMDPDMFIDFCILSGCDYTETLSQIGPVTAFNLIKKYKTIEEVIKNVDKNTENFNYLNARDIFKNFDSYIIPEPFIKTPVDKVVLLDFLNAHNFRQNVVNKYLKII